MPRVFLVTGCTSGFGANLVQEIIDHGDICVASARDPSKLSFKNTTDKNYLAVKLDVTKDEQIESAFAEALKTFNRVDVVVNNAGYGLCGPFEEVTLEQGRTQFEINFFGLTQVTRKALSVMREQKPSGGLIQNVTSVGGQIGVPTFSFYCATKWAVEGFTETLSKELKPEWGIKVSCIEPGGFRTDWSGRSMKFPEKRHPAYDHIDAQKNAKERNGSQPGDPAKGAKAMYKLATLEDPPLRMCIGTDGYAAVMKKLETYKELYETPEYKEIANSTDVDGYKAPE